MTVLLGGCWSNSSNGSSDGGGPDLAGLLCNDVPYGNVFIQEMDTGNPMVPAPTGGALTDGTYHLTASSYYPSAGCAFDPIASILLVSSSSPTGGTIQTSSLTSTGYVGSESISYLVSGTSLQIRIDCIFPDSRGLSGSAAQVSYNATPTEIQLYGTGGCSSHVDVYDLD